MVERTLGRAWGLRAGVAICSVAGALVGWNSAMAQGAADPDEAKDQEVGVTGTLVRGIAPAGANVVWVDQ
jgi:hypothetical protein